MTGHYKIGLVMKSLQAAFFQVMQEGAIQYANSLPELELICVGTDSQTEVNEQVALVRHLIAQKVDAIVLVPIDSKALVLPVAEAMKAGIPVINIDIMLDEELLKQAGVEVAFVGPDNLTAAYEVGKCLCSKLSQGDEVAIIEGLRNADNARQRKDGFLKAINEFSLRLVAAESANWETAQAVDVFQQIAKQHVSLKGVFCGNDAMALGVLEIMKQNGNYLPLVGFDNDAVMKQYLQSGRLIATVDIFSSQMAVHGIEYAVKVLEGTAKNEGIHLTPYSVVEG